MRRSSNGIEISLLCPLEIRHRGFSLQNFTEGGLRMNPNTLVIVVTQTGAVVKSPIFAAFFLPCCASLPHSFRWRREPCPQPTPAGSRRLWPGVGLGHWCCL